MTYFVTGASGFIGRRLVKRLLEREGTIYFLMLERELPKLDELHEFWGTTGERVVPVIGDLTQPKLGVSDEEIAKLKGNIKHMYHLAAIYDLKADAASQEAVNIQGTRNAVEFAHAVDAGCFNLTSSIASAGLYEGTFREDMFEEAEGLDHPYYRTKHESEGVVRRECKVPWRVYRPGIVVGDSNTGEMDKIDGPYYFFKLIQKFRRMVPPWVPTIGLEGGRINLVPVDFIVKAMDHISHAPGEDGKAFHLTDPNPYRVGDAMNLFARAAHAPQMTMRVNARLFDFIPTVVKAGITMLPPVRRITQAVLDDLGIPRDMMRFINYPTSFDCRETLRVLEGTDIRVPRLEDYAWRLWDYWERHLDPDLAIDRTLSGKVKGRVVVVTGASSGIGKATAIRMAASGAKVMLVARSADKLQETLDEITESGGEAYTYSADCSDLESCDNLIAKIQEEHGAVDVLVNNAGRSIRRSISLAFDRFHDFERCMQLNYFGALRLIMRCLPRMMERRQGQIINISSIGVLTNAPRFSAYVASKAALDAFSRCAASEFMDTGVSFTCINMPLVRTPMIAPTKVYDHVPTLSPEEAADLVAQAIIYRPTRIATRLGIFGQILHLVAPKIYQHVMNTAYRLFPDSSAAKGDKKAGAKAPSPEQIAFAQLTRGIYW